MTNATTAPPIDSFCLTLPSAPDGAGVIRFYGGLSLQATGDPTRGPSSACAITADLVGNIQSALAPLAPFMTLLDAVSSLGQCFILLTECLTNPFKIPELLKAVPSLVAKINKLLGLVPIFPQGILSLLEMCLDILNFILTQIECLLEVLRSIQSLISDLQSLADRINNTDDAELQAELLQFFECGSANAQQQTAAAVAVFGPLARLLCTVRALIALVPGGTEVAKRIGIPDLSGSLDLSGIIGAVTTIRDVISEVVQVIVAFGQVVGLELPTLTFSCPPLSDPPSTEPAVTPTIDALVDMVAPSTPIVTLPAATAPTDPALRLRLTGQGFTRDSKVFWNTSPISGTTFDGSSALEFDFPSALRLAVGDFYFAVVNEPAGASAAFAGITDPEGGGDNGVRVSNQFAVEVV